MKMKNVFITASLSILLGLGVAAGASVLSGEKSVVTVSAAGAYRPGTAGRNVYMNCQGTGWDGANAKLVFHRYENSNYQGYNTWYLFSKISVLGDSNSQLYMANPEYNAWSCKFRRVDPGDDSKTWNELSYGDLSYAGTSNVYKITGSFSGNWDSDSYNIYKLSMVNNSSCGTAYIENNSDKIYAGNYGYIYKHVTYTVTAIPQAGYKLDHWTVSSSGYTIGSGSLTSDTFTISGINDDTTITAYYTTAMTIAKGKARIWIGFGSGNYKYTNDSAAIVLWVHSTSGGGSEHVYKSTTAGVWGTFTNSGTGLDGLRYDWFDIDLSDYTNGWYLTIQRYDSSGNTYWNGSNSLQLTTSNVGKVYYAPNASNYSGNITVGTITKVHAAMASIALAGCLTCSSSNYNGCGNNFRNVESSFIKNGDSFRTVGELSSYNVYDYETGDISYTGGRTKVVNAYTKYQWLRYMSGEDSVMPSALVNVLLRKSSFDNSTSLVIIIISIVSVAAVGGYFFFRKKKNK